MTSFAAPNLWLVRTIGRHVEGNVLTLNWCRPTVTEFEGRSWGRPREVFSQNKRSSCRDFRPGTPEVKVGVALSWRQFCHVPLKIVENTMKRVRAKHLNTSNIEPGYNDFGICDTSCMSWDCISKTRSLWTTCIFYTTLSTMIHVSLAANTDHLLDTVTQRDSSYQNFLDSCSEILCQIFSVYEQNLKMCG